MNRHIDEQTEMILYTQQIVSAPNKKGSKDVNSSFVSDASKLRKYQIPDAISLTRLDSSFGEDYNYDIRNNNILVWKTVVDSTKPTKVIISVGSYQSKVDPPYFRMKDCCKLDCDRVLDWSYKKQILYILYKKGLDILLKYYKCNDTEILSPPHDRQPHLFVGSGNNSQRKQSCSKNSDYEKLSNISNLSGHALYQGGGKIVEYFCISQVDKKTNFVSYFTEYPELDHLKSGIQGKEAQNTIKFRSISKINSPIKYARIVQISDEKRLYLFVCDDNSVYAIDLEDDSNTTSLGKLKELPTKISCTCYFNIKKMKSQFYEGVDGCAQISIKHGRESDVLNEFISFKLFNKGKSIETINVISATQSQSRRKNGARYVELNTNNSSIPEDKENINKRMNILSYWCRSECNFKDFQVIPQSPTLIQVVAWSRKNYAVKMVEIDLPDINTNLTKFQSMSLSNELLFMAYESSSCNTQEITIYAHNLAQVLFELQVALDSNRKVSSRRVVANPIKLTTVKRNVCLGRITNFHLSMYKGGLVLLGGEFPQKPLNENIDSGHVLCLKAQENHLQPLEIIEDSNFNSVQGKMVSSLVDNKLFYINPECIDMMGILQPTSDLQRTPNTIYFKKFEPLSPNNTRSKKWFTRLFHAQVGSDENNLVFVHELINSELKLTLYNYCNNTWSEEARLAFCDDSAFIESGISDVVNKQQRNYQEESKESEILDDPELKNHEGISDEPIEFMNNTDMNQTDHANEELDNEQDREHEDEQENDQDDDEQTKARNIDRHDNNDEDDENEGDQSGDEHQENDEDDDNPNTSSHIDEIYPIASPQMTWPMFPSGKAQPYIWFNYNGDIKALKIVKS